ncbi:MAG TPA: tetratricopeptide repeat protein [Candidatus Methanoperedens sp.]
MELNKLDKAVEFQEKKLGYLLHCNDVENISLIYRNLISNYFELKNWKKVDQLCIKKIKLDSERDDKKELVIVYSILAVTLRKLKKYNSSIKYHKLCINLAIEIEDNNVLATAYNDLGNTFSIVKNVKEAEECFLESIRIKKNIGNEVGVMASHWSSVKEFYWAFC